MIRLGHISDSHFDARGRLADTIAVHAAFVEQARAADVDLIVHAGDLFERRSTPEERNAAAEFLRAAAEVAPVYLVKGNHDAAGDLSIFARLKTRHPIIVEERATAAPGSAQIISGAWNRVGGPPALIGLLGMAWIDKAHMVAGIDAEAGDIEATRGAAISGVRALLDCLRLEAARVRAEGATPVLVTHAMLGGSVVSTGQVLIGQGLDLSPSDLLEVGAAYTAVGHVHCAQRFFDGRVGYSGSPDRQTFGEPEAKGWNLATLDRGEFVSCEFRELPARRMVLLEADAVGLPADVSLLGDIADTWTLEQVAGALVRLRYRIRAEDAHRVDPRVLQQALLADGAVEAQVEAIVQAETRARVPEIASAPTLASKFAAYLRAKGIEQQPADRDRLLGKLAALERRAIP